MSGLISKILAGNIPVREYSTVSLNGAIRERVYLLKGGQCMDISGTQWLLCLDPVVFGVWIENPEHRETRDLERNTAHEGYPVQKDGRGTPYKIWFTDSPSDFADSPCDDGSGVKKNWVAMMELDLFDKVTESTGILLLLRLRTTRINHVHPVRSFLLYLKYYKKPRLPFTKFKALVSAFSYPRMVRLISFRKEGYYNIFSMDLVGEINPGNRHVFGLRHSNTALAGIMQTEALVVAEVSAGYKNILYQMGKYHNTAPPPLEELPFRVIQSGQFGFYLPEWVESYKEIRIIKTIDLGSHMLLWGECVNEVSVNEVSVDDTRENGNQTHWGHLFHIHFLHYLHQRENGVEFSLI